ncbi:hypothetical protein L873DRAFT_1407810 [Choiromyces venosus 120613-1]|uniref:Uncharacterized protein n=1 Tax=Choiromyces venosus 120613-1 TaxID=1336337 RepID=A0A3N4J975_9PEZI|nr:hypothetical protein L873DRAFT_1407810 [Choiromyces venosus 120613-1]
MICRYSALPPKSPAKTYSHCTTIIPRQQPPKAISPTTDSTPLFPPSNLIPNDITPLPCCYSPHFQKYHTAIVLQPTGRTGPDHVMSLVSSGWLYLHLEGQSS